MKDIRDRLIMLQRFNVEGMGSYPYSKGQWVKWKHVAKIIKQMEADHKVTDKSTMQFEKEE